MIYSLFIEAVNNELEKDFEGNWSSINFGKVKFSGTLCRTAW